MRKLCWITGLLLIGFASSSSVHAGTTSQLTPHPAAISPGRPARATLSEGYGKIPIAFEPNRGQADAGVRFLARGSGYSLALADNEAILALAGRQAVVQLQWLSARRPARVEGQGRLPGVSNYFRGSDPAKWRMGIPQFGRVKFSGVYPGIDLVYYGKQRELEYDVVLSPHADPRQLRLRIRGAERIRISPEGDLVLSVPGGEILQRKPFLYQMQGQSRRQIQGRYELRADGEVGFAVVSYDRRKPLVIDPVLSYATYLGGTGGDGAYGVAVDGSGNAYVTGDTASVDFPTLGSPPFQTARKGSTDVFVAKLNAAGTSLLYSTYLGGTGSQSGKGISIDGDGAAYIGGYTTSADFPITPGAFQTGGPSQPWVNVGFVSKLNAAGSALIYSTFIGQGAGYRDTYVNAVAVDAAGCAYVTGETGDSAIPTSATAFQPDMNGYDSAFVIKLNTAGTGEVYGTYLGGDRGDSCAYGIALDASGNACLAGWTVAVDFPLRNPIQASLPNSTGGWHWWGDSGFVAKLNADASDLIFSTYLGGVRSTDATAIAVDGSGNAYVTGVIHKPSSGSDIFPLQNPLQPAPGGGTDAFLTKFSPAGALVYSTYLGGSGDDSGLAVRIDGAGNAYVAGNTFSSNFPVINALQPYPGGGDMFVLKTVDGGTTWETSSVGEAPGAVNTLAVNPETPAMLYAGTATGRVFRSSDGGAHWIRSDTGLPGAPVSSLAIDAGAAAALYAGTAAGVFKSTDGGSTWSERNAGLSNTTVQAVAVDPGDGGIVYAATGSGASGAIFMSTDGGGVWAPVATSDDTYFTSLVIHPVTPQYVYAGTADGYIVYSFDRFATGPRVNNPGNNISSVNALAIDPEAGKLYVAVSTRNSPEIVYVTRTMDLQCYNGVCEIYFYDYKGPGLSLAVSPSGKLFVGRTSIIWGVANVPSIAGPFRAIAADPLTDGTLYVGNSETPSDAFLTVVNPAGSARVFSSYLGGSGSDEGRALAVDSSGKAWLAGITKSPDFPATPNARQTANAGGSDAFVVKFMYTNFTLGGYLGVGTPTPERAIHIQGPNAVFRMDRSQDTAAFMIVRNDTGANILKTFVVGVNATGANNGSFVINDLGASVSGGGANRLTIDNTGTAAFSGQVKATGFVTTSSSRFKQNIQPIFGALAAVTRLQGRRFDWLSTGEAALGLIAEEAAQVVPELATGGAGQPFGLDYGRLAALLLEGVKCQQAQLDALKQKRDRLERLLQELEQSPNLPARHVECAPPRCALD